MSYTFKEKFSFRENKFINLTDGLQIQVYSHMILKNGERIVSIAMVNTNQQDGNDIQIISKLSVFQPVLRVSSLDDNSIFSNIKAQKYFANDSELLEMELLYSDVNCYAQGHGCSVKWDTENLEPRWLSSSFMPTFNLLQMKPANFGDDKILSMKFLAKSSIDKVEVGLKNFLKDYQNWIDELSEKTSTVKDDLKSIASDNIEKCQNSHDRIAHAIELLKNDKVSFRAFQLANEAMLMQRIQTISKSDKSFDRKTFDEFSVRWYPFQLAFILQELSSFIEPKGNNNQNVPEREIVDLLWFPTGGGKTEAYLGITAFVIFLRRLRNPSDDGVTVMMRYTLRLLTLQQFERASILIFACELLRQKYNLGGSEISIGLWVGGGLTPNKLKDTQVALNKLQQGADVSEDENPYQIRVCPWCGEKLNVEDYYIKMPDSRMIIKCHNKKCDFHNFPNGLPMHIIDEAIYKHLPDFIIATIDKFAQIPLKDEPAALFGITSNKKPPELIIQDELHLISGPLGTITGIYEAAITKLCEKDGIGAKIIASTATIRNASNQILNLYGKTFSQFPPQGLSAKDSFFAVQSTAEDKPARLYVGVMGIGTTATTTMVRVYGALLFATRYLSSSKNFSDKVVDNFWTIVGYFNTLKELGGTCTQVVDDVQSRFSYLAKTKFASKYPGVNGDEIYDNIEELTSRMNNSEITDVIQNRLKCSYNSGNHKDVYDFVLASNMISVGVDVGRLGLMIVAGQPKTNAEYIQATSRVGRDNPGLVVTLYNAARSRDRSHYEQFMKYHSALYRYVEATSLTPFSDRARDRGLQALYVSLCRYLVENLRKNPQAVNFNSNSTEVKKIEQMIVDYVQKIEPSEIEALKNELKDIAEKWDELAAGNLIYKSYNKDDKMLIKSDIENDRLSMMNSMRSVDGQAGIYLLGRE